VFIETVSNCRKATLHALILGKIDKSVVIYANGWCGYDEPVDVGQEMVNKIARLRPRFVTAIKP